MGPLAWLCCLAVVVSSTVARPSAEVSGRDARGQTISDSSDPSGLQTRVLEYYGGAKDHGFLVIHPSGRRTVSRTPPPLRANKPNKPNKPAKPVKPDKEEEDVGMAPEEETDTDNESVAINPPPDNASVAEAKPVGLAIAGPGGVASSKPVAQAIVGPGGLAVARPVATAIAGVKGGGVPGAVAGKAEDEEAAPEGRKQVFFDPETNLLHSTPFIGQRHLYPINYY